MAGIYFHIPFCKRICGYCDFYKSVKIDLLEPVLNAMHCELAARNGFLHDRQLRTLYFGGGTPSLCTPPQIQAFIDQAKSLFDASALTECTAEVNPDDLNSVYLKNLRSTGVNRLSIGIQSFDDAELRGMNRRHTAAQAIQAVHMAQDAGFDNLTIDLIFGVRGFGIDILRKNLDTALTLGVQHLSAYHLSIEPNTAFGRKAQRGDFSAVSETESEAEYRLIHTTLTEAGYQHYEISNYALPGFRAQHNAAYWTGAEYLGIGPAAHSFDGQTRCWSEDSVESYITAEAPRFGTENLTERDHFNEYIMTALRTVEGIDTTYVKQRFGALQALHLQQRATPFLATNTLRSEGKQLFLDPDNYLIADTVIGTLFE
ncbi:MAG: radical SAM family heme chaperone HemW [Alistipes sp.]